MFGELPPELQHLILVLSAPREGCVRWARTILNIAPGLAETVAETAARCLGWRTRRRDIAKVSWLSTVALGPPRFEFLNGVYCFRVMNLGTRLTRVGIGGWRVAMTDRLMKPNSGHLCVDDTTARKSDGTRFNIRRRLRGTHTTDTAAWTCARGVFFQRSLRPPAEMGG